MVTQEGSGGVEWRGKTMFVTLEKRWRTLAHSGARVETTTVMVNMAMGET